MDDLPELRDIHLPEEMMMFPLGYGMIVLLVLALVFAVLFPFLKRAYLRSKKHYALCFLKNLRQENMKDVCQISEILRRVCKIRHKRAVALFGKPWADFLKKTTSGKLSQKEFDILINAPYAPLELNVEKKDFEAIKNFALQWVEDNL